MLGRVRWRRTRVESPHGIDGSGARSWITALVVLFLVAPTDARAGSRRLLVATGADGRAIQATSLPSRIADEASPDQSLWIATTELVDAEGNLLGASNDLPRGWLENRTLALVLERYERFRSGEAREPCLGWTSRLDYARRPPLGFDELVAQAPAAVRGRVIGAVGGFLRGDPGIVLEVAVLEKRTGDAWYAGQDRLFLFQAAQIPFGVTTICARYVADGHGPGSPDPGEEILLLPSQHSRPLHSVFPILYLDTRGYELLYERDGVVRAGSTLFDVHERTGPDSLRSLWGRALLAKRWERRQ